MSIGHTSLAPLFTWRSAICDSGLDPTARHVALALSLYMNERGGSAFPGAERLAHDTGLTERTVRTKLALLVAEGWLDLIERGGRRGERKRSNAYEARTPETGSPVNVTRTTGEPRSPQLSIEHSNDSPNGESPDLSSHSDQLLPLLDKETDPTEGTATARSGQVVAALVASYVEDVQRFGDGTPPPRSFRAAAGKAVRKALADGESAEHVGACLQVIARERKQPASLPFVILDSHAGAPRRTHDLPQRR